MAVKEKKVKWALGSGEPDDLQDFKDNEQIVKENKGLPPKGTYTLAVRWLRVKPNKNGDDRISTMLVMDEPKKGKGAPWNGYVVWDGFNVTEQGAPFIKRFLKAMGLSWSDFTELTKQDEQDPPHITRIGKVRFESGKDPHVRALLKIVPPDDYNADERMEVQRYIPVEDDAADDADDDGEDEGTDLGVDASDDDEAKGETLTVDRLEKMDIDELTEVASQAGIKKKGYKGLKKKALRELILQETNLPPF